MQSKEEYDQEQADLLEKQLSASDYKPMQKQYTVVVGIIVDAESEDDAMGKVSSVLNEVEEFKYVNVDYAD